LDLLTLYIGFFIILILGFISLKVGIVTYSGLIAGFLVGIPIIILPEDGLKWFALILAFHILAGQFTKYKYEVKRRKGVAQEKGGAREWHNVIANGATAILMAFFSGIWGNPIFLAGFIGAIATSTSDTLATEIGLLYPKSPRLITNINRKVPPGTSGGITIFGELATILGSTLIGLLALILGLGGRLTEWSPVMLLFIAIISGFAGSTFDSFLGATIQGIFKCKICGKITENKVHCKKNAEKIKGFNLLDNNLVNLTSTIVGAILAMVIFKFL
jgi:uncharacterized protein (TIGR00297 family)